jgi:hypothetical protein
MVKTTEFIVYCQNTIHVMYKLFGAATGGLFFVKESSLGTKTTIFYG